MREAAAAVPCCVPEVSGLADAGYWVSATTRAEVRGRQRRLAGVERRLGVLPFGAAVLPLEGVVVEFRAECEAAREGAGAEQICG